MSKQQSKTEKPLEVTIMFEPSRLAATHLADAYRQVVPLRLRATPGHCDSAQGAVSPEPRAAQPGERS